MQVKRSAKVRIQDRDEVAEGGDRARVIYYREDGATGRCRGGGGSREASRGYKRASGRAGARCRLVMARRWASNTATRWPKAETRAEAVVMVGSEMNQGTDVEEAKAEKCGGGSVKESGMGGRG